MQIKMKKKGVILLEAVLAIILLGMVSYGFAATSTLQYQQLDAVKVAAQAREYAEVEAKYVQALGYYNIETEKGALHNDKTDMESLIGTTGWKSVTKLVSTKVLPGYEDDTRNLDEYKVKVISIDVYKGEESMPRFSLSVPLSLQDSSYGVPIGTVIAWPLGSAPLGLHEDHWLECNGQEVNKSKYPRLAELMSNVPDYQGMFLRGLGNQSYSQYNGVNVGTSTTYSSGGLGATQGDAIRNITSTLGHQQFYYSNGGTTIGIYGKSSNVFHYSTTTHGYLTASYPYINGWYEYGTKSDSYGGGWYDALTKYKYSISGDEKSGYKLNEEVIHPNLEFIALGADLDMDLSLAIPTAEEIRPVNKAVRYMIKAK